MNPLFSVMRIVTFVALVVATLSCKKPTPVEPTMAVVVAGNIINSNYQGTLLRCDLLLDNTVMSSAIFSQPSGGAEMSGTATGVTKGNHTLSFKIVNQTTSPNTYETVGVYVSAGSSNYTLTDQRKSLATGEALAFPLNLQ